jgi:hypothetical protein
VGLCLKGMLILEPAKVREELFICVRRRPCMTLIPAALMQNQHRGTVIVRLGRFSVMQDASQGTRRNVGVGMFLIWASSYRVKATVWPDLSRIKMMLISVFDPTYLNHLKRRKA